MTRSRKSSGLSLSNATTHSWSSSPKEYVVLSFTDGNRSEEHTSELQSRPHLVCRLLLGKNKQTHRWQDRLATQPRHPRQLSRLEHHGRGRGANEPVRRPGNLDNPYSLARDI